MHRTIYSDRSDFIISSRARSLLTARGLSQLQNSMHHKSMNICLVSANDVMWRFVMDHFAFPGNIDFAADDQGAFSRIIFERLCLCVYSSSVKQCLPSVNHEQFPMQLTHKHNKWLQILAQEDFPPKLLWSKNADFKFSVNNEGEDVNKQPRRRENIA